MAAKIERRKVRLRVISSNHYLKLQEKFAEKHAERVQQVELLSNAYFHLSTLIRHTQDT